MRNLLNVSRIAKRASSKTSAKTSASEMRSQLYEEVLVVGDRDRIALRQIAPKKAVSVQVDVTGEVEISDWDSRELFATGIELPLEKVPDWVGIATNQPSEVLNDRSIQITYAGDNGKILVSYKLHLSALRICLDVDADRDGIVEQNSPNKSRWKWGPDGYGAILLVNNDRDEGKVGRRDLRDRDINGPLDLNDLSPMVVRQVGPGVLPPGCELRILVTDAAAERIRIFDKRAPGGRLLIGPGVPQANLPDIRDEIVLGIEGLDYPDREFTGLVTINLILVRREKQLYQESVVFRVAPWIMTPHILDPLEVYVCRLKKKENQPFIEDLKAMVDRASAKLVIVPAQLNRGDRWIQDEIEIGYSQTPNVILPVVLDSPRDRELDKFPKEKLLGPDFGYVTRSQGKANSLDSFGNLEVSPPVTVDGVDYPLGRIIFGGALPTATAGRRVMQVVREFLYGQQVQSPIELYSDWLAVAHVDEFMTFIPAPTPKGFKLLLASPDRCYLILQELQDSGHGDAILLEGKKRFKEPADITVSELLSDRTLAGHNSRYQDYINWNRDILMRSLGLSEEDIIDLPGLFYPLEFGGGAAAFFPDMINMIVLGNHLGIPKPYGPKINEKCQFEAYVEEVLGKFGSICHFLDDYDVYHQNLGNVHCATSTRRQPFTFKWWNAKPQLSVDI